MGAWLQEAVVKLAAVAPGAGSAGTVLYTLCEAAVRHLEAHALRRHKRGGLHSSMPP